MALVLVRDFRRVPSVAAGIAFFVTIAAHFVLTSPDYAGLRALDPILYPAALVVPSAFWLFSRALFDEESGLSWRDAAMFATLLATGFLRSTPAAGVGTVLYYASSLALSRSPLPASSAGYRHTPSDSSGYARCARAFPTRIAGMTNHAERGRRLIRSVHLEC
jgi:hypothetical protein